jgi:1,4-dihydroxy-2-naphthoate octaprenyltransferase
VSPVLLGTGIAVRDGEVRTGPGILALAVALALQVGVNYANDYSDFRRGADTPARVGPPRAAASGVVRPEAVRAAAIAAFGAAMVAGLALSLLTNPWLIVLGAACVAAGWLYTGGPRPYGYAGLGELFVFVFFGVVAVAGTVYAHELRVTADAWLAGAACGCLAAAILGLNNLRDVDTDRAAAKRTLAVMIGRPAARAVIFALVVLAFALALLRREWPVLLAAPLAVAALATMRSQAPPVLVRGLRRMAATEMVFALLWCLGLLS